MLVSTFYIVAIVAGSISRRASLGSMRRAFHIKLAVSLMIVILLLAPFDCFASGAPSRQVADCCLKGHCAPAANSDACCKNFVPDRDQFVPQSTAEHSSPLIAIEAVHVPTLTLSSTSQAFADSAREQLVRIESTPPSLPLLI
jgi:hypothetical protein